MLHSPPTGQHLGSNHSELAAGLANAAVGQSEGDGSREDTMDVEGQLVSLQEKNKKTFLCFVSNLKMLSDLACKQPLLSTVLVPVNSWDRTKISVDTAHTKARQLDLTFKGDKWA